MVTGDVRQRRGLWSLALRVALPGAATLLLAASVTACTRPSEEPGIDAAIAAAVAATVGAAPTPTPHILIATPVPATATPAPTSTPVPSPTATRTPTPVPTPPPTELVSATAEIREDNALIAEVSISLDEAARVYVEYGNSEAGRFRTLTTESASESHTVSLVRLRPETQYEYTVFVEQPDGTFEEAGDGSVTSGELPPLLRSINIEATGAPTSDLVLMDYKDNGAAYILALDQGSNIVWYYEDPGLSPGVPTTILGIQRRPNGNLLYTGGAPNAPCCIREITPLGRQVDQLAASDLDDVNHHDLLLWGPDKVLYLGEETRTIDDTANGGSETTRVTGDTIRIWDQSTGATEEVWNAFDSLSTDDRVIWQGNTVRWTHFNSISLGPQGQIVVSSRNRNQVIIINPDFESEKWFIGGPNSDFTFPNPEDKFFRQHTATLLPNGNLLVFDNGADRPEEEGGLYSRALELTIDDYDMTATKVWEYRADPDIFASFISSAFRLDNGNTLVNFGTTPDVVGIPITAVEVNRQGDEVWKMEMTSPSLRMRFRVYAMDSIMGETEIAD